MGAGRVNFALVGMGLLMIAVALWSAWMNRRAADWPAVPGVIVRSELLTPTDAEATVRIEYEYRAGGELQRGSMLSYAGRSPAESDKAAQVATYPVGREVMVYVDPANPGRAVLERPASRAWLAMAAAGLVLVAGALFFRL